MEHSNEDTNDLDVSLLATIAITRPIYAYVLIAFIAVSLIGLTWSVFGSIAQKIEGVGEIDTIDGLERVSSIYGGSIIEKKVELNDSVIPGDVILIIERPELEFAIQEMAFSIKRLKQKKVLTYSGNSKNSSINKKVDKLAVSRLKGEIKEINKNILFFEKRISQEKELIEKGLITYNEYVDTQTNFSALKTEKISLEEQLNIIILDSEERNFDLNLTENDISTQLLNLEMQLADLKKDYKFQTEVTAKKAGTIRSLNFKVGDVITENVVLAIIHVHETKLKDYVLNLYIPFDTNEVISEGMDVDIEPFNVDHNLYGWLKGKVKYVNPFTSTYGGLVNTLENKSLIQLIEDKGSVYHVIVQLDTDPNTFSGFEWTNKIGPPNKILPGQLTLAYVHVRVKAPIDFVLPIFSDFF